MSYPSFSLVSILIGCVALNVSGQERTQPVSVSFRLAAKDVPNMDIFNGRPDPYVSVTLFNTKTSPGVKLGDTSKLANTNNANWTNIFTLNYPGGSLQSLKFDLWDEDINKDDFIGTVDVTVGTIVTTFGGVINVPFTGNKAANSRLIITRV